MFKKVCYLIICVIFGCGFVYAEDETSLAENAKSAIIMEASTGDILFEKNSYEKLPPASMTKIMTMLLIMENIENGNLSWDDEVTASENDSSMGGSQIFLEAGEVMSVKDMVKGIAIASGNDAAVAMAEKIAGTEEEFVKLMNNRAKELGLENTNFKNVTGLEAENHYSSAHDMAVMARELIKHEKILEFTGTYEDYLRENTDKKFWLVNTNKLVRFYQGVDGLKTGYTGEAGYCLTSTMKRGNMRIITVVMNEPDSATRNSETVKMLDYAFGMYKVDTIVAKGKVVEKREIPSGDKVNIEISAKSDINVLRRKMDKDRDISYKTEVYDIKLPVNKGDVVGKIYLYEGSKKIGSGDLTVKDNVKKAGLFKVYIRNIGRVLSGKMG